MSGFVAPLTGLAPRQAWEIMARSDRSTLLIGDCNHMNYKIMDQLTMALPALGAAGFRHLGRELSQAAFQGAVNAFNQAGTLERLSGRDVQQFADSLADYTFPTDRHNPQQGDYKPRFLAQVMICRRENIGFHCLNFNELYPACLVAEPEIRRMQLLNYSTQTLYDGRIPSQVAPADRPLIDLAAKQIMQHNSEGDRDRAAALLALGKSGRVALMYGAGHFVDKAAPNGLIGDGINKFLPAESFAYVQVGTRKEIERVNAGMFGSLLPGDIHIYTDENKAAIMPTPTGRKLMTLA